MEVAWAAQRGLASLLAGSPGFPWCFLLFSCFERKTFSQEAGNTSENMTIPCFKVQWLQITRAASRAGQGLAGRLRKDKNRKLLRVMQSWGLTRKQTLRDMGWEAHAGHPRRHRRTLPDPGCGGAGGSWEQSPLTGEVFFPDYGNACGLRRGVLCRLNTHINMGVITLRGAIIPWSL